MTLVQPETQTPDPILAPDWGALAGMLSKAGYGGKYVGLIKANMDRFTSFLDELDGKANPLLTADWLETLVANEQAALTAFFGREIDLTFFRETLAKYGQEKLKEWAEKLLEPHFIPLWLLARNVNYPGWDVKPNDFFWDALVTGNLLRKVGNDLVKVEPTQLQGIVVLVDRRLKPHYKGGGQPFASDKKYLGGIIERLREQGTLSHYQYGSQNSRFGVSANEIQEHVIPEAAKLLGLDVSQVIIEPALVANVVPQIYKHMPRHKDGKSDTWMWYDEYFESAASRLYGGSSGYGGLANVCWGDATGRSSGLAFRLLGVLATQELGA